MTSDLLAQMSLHLVGCGKMGSALLKSWLDAGVSPKRVSARTATTESAAKLTSTYGIYASDSVDYAGQDIVVLGVKPQMLPAVLPRFKGQRTPLYLCLAAGTPLAALQRDLGVEARIIRSMPNTPSRLGKGMTTLVAGERATEKDRDWAAALFHAAGEVLWLQEETLMDAAAAIAGSGPAYLFHFAEALIANAESLGFTPAQANLLVTQTLSGSAALADAEDWDVGRLRQEVTSKAGVTEAALGILMPALTPLLEKALAANIARAKALADS